MANADFDVQLDRHIEKYKSRVKEFPQALALEALARLKEYTPVVTGNLRASWTIFFKPNGFNISTGVIYARRVEFGFVGEDSAGKYFNQSGRGMIARTVADLPQLAETVAERLGAK